MPFIPVPNCAHVQIYFVDDGQQVINNLYFARGDSIDAAELTALATAIDNRWVGVMMPLLSGSITYVRTVATDLTTQFGLQLQVSSGPEPGGNAGEQAPNNVAACISFRTGFRGRSFRGRNFVAGIPNAAIATNTLDAGFISDIEGVYGGLFGVGNILPVGWSWVVVSRETNGGPRATGIFTNVVDVTFTDNTVDSQRRRLPGRGS